MPVDVDAAVSLGPGGHSASCATRTGLVVCWRDTQAHPLTRMEGVNRRNPKGSTSGDPNQGFASGRAEEGFFSGSLAHFCHLLGYFGVNFGVPGHNRKRTVLARASPFFGSRNATPLRLFGTCGRSKRPEEAPKWARNTCSGAPSSPGSLFRGTRSRARGRLQWTKNAGVLILFQL